MKDGFTRKKVESLTLGEKLKKLRGDFRMSLSEISKATRIQVKYLEYLENGEYHKLPADVYVRGFLRSYAHYLNIDEQAFINLYERERHIQVNLNQETEKKTFNVKNLSISSFVITPRSIVVVMIFLLVVAASFYLFREFQAFAGAPRLIILSPAERTTIIETNEIIVQGKTDKGARVSINNQSVFVGSAGEFSDKLTLQSGLNTVTIVAINRFDKEKSETLSIEAHYTPETADAGRDGAKTKIAETFHTDVSVHDSPAKVTIEADGTIVFSGILKVGESQTAEAKDAIRIISENPAKTFIRFNGASEELPLGDGQTSKAGVVFLSTGRQE